MFQPPNDCLLQGPIDHLNDPYAKNTFVEGAMMFVCTDQIIITDGEQTETFVIEELERCYEEDDYMVINMRHGHWSFYFTKENKGYVPTIVETILDCREKYRERIRRSR